MKWNQYDIDPSTLSDEDRMYIRLQSEIVALRLQQKSTQRDVANKTGLKQPAIARLENPSERANVMTILKVLNSMGFELTIQPKTHKDCVSNE